MISRSTDGSVESIGVNYCRKRSQLSINLQSSNQRKVLAVDNRSFLSYNRSKGDTSNFSSYPDSSELPKPIKPSEDPFVGW